MAAVDVFSGGKGALLPASNPNDRSEVKKQQDEGLRTSSGTSGGSLRKSCLLPRTSASQQVEFAPKGPVKGVKGPSGKRDLIRKFCQPIRAVGADAKIKTSGGVRRESP